MWSQLFASVFLKERFTWADGVATVCVATGATIAAGGSEGATFAGETAEFRNIQTAPSLAIDGLLILAILAFLMRRYLSGAMDGGRSVYECLACSILGGLFGCWSSTVTKLTVTGLKNAAQGTESGIMDAAPIYFCLIGLFGALTLQLGFLNAALKRYDALTAVPPYECTITLGGVAYGWLFLGEAKGVDTSALVGFLAGCALCCIGVMILSSKPRLLAWAPNNAAFFSRLQGAGGAGKWDALEESGEGGSATPGISNTHSSGHVGAPPSSVNGGGKGGGVHLHLGGSSGVPRNSDEEDDDGASPHGMQMMTPRRMPGGGGASQRSLAGSSGSSSSHSSGLGPSSSSLPSTSPAAAGAGIDIPGRRPASQSLGHGLTKSDVGSSSSSSSSSSSGSGGGSVRAIRRAISSVSSAVAGRRDPVSGDGDEALLSGGGGGGGTLVAIGASYQGGAVAEGSGAFNKPLLNG